MKQATTKEQWEELSVEQRFQFLDKLGIFIKTAAMGFSTMIRQGQTTDGFLPTIGQMIEFLGDDLKSIMKLKNYILSTTLRDIVFMEEELCDALWEAVKDKLTN